MMAGMAITADWRALPRCLMRGCPVVFRSGPPRACPMHADEDYRLTARAAAMGVMMAAPPGERDGGDGDGGDGHRAARQAVNKHGIPVR